MVRLIFSVKRNASDSVIRSKLQVLAVAHQGVHTPFDIRLGCYLPRQNSIKVIGIGLIEEQSDGRVRRRIVELGAEQLAENFSVLG